MQSSGNSEKGAKGRKKLGEFLVEAGLIDRQTLDRALSIQKAARKRIGQVLIDMGVADDLEIARALAGQLKILENILESGGFQVTVIENGLDALKLTLQEKPDLPQ